MDIIELDTRVLKSPHEIVEALIVGELKAGDQVIVLTEEAELALISVMSIVFMAIQKVMNSKRRDFGERVIADIFETSKAYESLEMDIEERYGIKVEIKPPMDTLRNDWSKLASQGLNKAYGTDEPDYSQMMVKEPNPLYGKKMEG